MSDTSFFDARIHQEQMMTESLRQDAAKLEISYWEDRIKRPYPRTAPCAVVCRGDGDQIGAMIGPNPMEGVVGYGDDLPSALRALADELEREVGQVPLAAALAATETPE